MKTKGFQTMSAQLKASDLSGIATEINAEHSAAVESARSAIDHARRCGDLLIQAKCAVGHGGFLKWLGEHCQVKERQARNYMKLSENWGAIESKTAPGADLTIKGALGLLNAPKPPSGSIEFYLESGAINEGHVHQLERLRTVFGDQRREFDEDHWPADGTGAEEFLILRSARPYEFPMWNFYRLKRDQQHFDMIREACRLYRDHVTSEGHKPLQADVASFWWASLCADVNLHVELLTDLVSWWKNRFYSSLLWTMIYPNPDERWHSLLLGICEAFAEDLNCSGCSHWPNEEDKYSLPGVQARVKSGLFASPSKFAPWGPRGEEWSEIHRERCPGVMGFHGKPGRRQPAQNSLT